MTQSLDAQGRYVFSYDLAELAPDGALGFDEYVGRVLAALLPLIQLTEGGRPVEPDGFRLRREDLVRADIKPIFPPAAEPDGAVMAGADVGCSAPPDSTASGAATPGFRQARHRQLLSSVRSSEPRIHMLAEHLHALLQIMVPECRGDALPVDGFRLKDLNQWRVPSSGDPSEIYEHLSRVCNISCEFCYLHGNPPDLAVGKARFAADLEELDTRLSYFEPQRGSALFRSQWEINEFLVSPHTVDVLERLRVRTAAPFFFITNGNPLTPEMVAALDRLKPVFLIVSVNSVDIGARVRVMRDSLSKAETAIASFELLHAARIPYGASIVMWPGIGLDSLEHTLEFLEPYDPAYVRVNLPGFTRHTPAAVVPKIDTDRYWQDVVEEVIRLRSRFGTPIFAIPHMFEELVTRPPNEVRILGTVRRSPAADAGIRAGDVITTINGLPVVTRQQAISLLWMLRDRTIRVRVERDGGPIDVQIAARSTLIYPDQGDVYGKYLFPRGIVLAASVGVSQVQQIAQVIERHRPSKVLVVTSKLMRRAVADLLQRFGNEAVRRTAIVYCLAENEYLGGNIQIMDMCTVSDFVRAIRRGIAEHGRPDCVVLPDSAFNEWGRDLTGEWRGAIARRSSVPVEFIDSPRFAF